MPEKSRFVGRRVEELEALGHGDLTVTAIIRENFRRHVPAGHWTLLAGDILVLECDPSVLKTIVDEAGLELIGSDAVPVAGGNLLRLSDPDRASIEHAGNGARRLPLRRLLEAWPAFVDHRRGSRRAIDHAGLAVVRGRTVSTSRTQ